jgi:hypothetical protein
MKYEMIDYDYVCSRYILIEGPGWRDASFLGQWLLAAAKADELLIETPAEEFSINIGDNSFGPAALDLIRRLSNNGSTTCFCLEEIFDVELFALMEGMGLYIRIDDRYGLALPENLTRERVKTVVRSFFELNYQPALSHMATIPLARVEAYAKLTKMDEDERIAEQKAALLTC